ncbi:hypothetical protein HID58_070405, partial [Brassica napus]
VSRPVSFAGEAIAKLILGVPRRFRWVNFLVSREALRHSRIWGNVVRLSVSSIYEEHQKAKNGKCILFIPLRQDWRGLLLRLMAASNHDPLVDTHRRLIGEVFFLRSQVQDMMAGQDLLVQQVRELARWELMKEWLVSQTSIPVRRDRPAVGEFFPSSHPKVCCGVAIFGGAFFLNDFS